MPDDHLAAKRAAEDRVLRAVEQLPPARYLLAVSGGRDSMVLLDAFQRVRADAIGVGTFDHGTGAHATQAALLVRLEAERAGIAVHTVRRTSDDRREDESAWRNARWRFLRGAALSLQAEVTTAHTRDDQLETVVMRVLRDARHTSTRGLAGMYAERSVHAVARPLLDVSRGDIALYAALRDVRYLDDPSNASRLHLRNRIRLDLLPALELARPGFSATMLAISRRAAEWRRAIETMVGTLGAALAGPGVLSVPASALEGLDNAGLALVWPVLAERVGVALDWRGTERVVAFTRVAKPLRRIPLSGGASVQRTPQTFVLRAKPPSDTSTS